MKTITIIITCSHDYLYTLGHTLPGDAWHRGQPKTYLAKLFSATRGLLRALDHSHWFQMLIIISLWLLVNVGLWAIYY